LVSLTRVPVADLRRRVDALQPELGEALTRVLQSGRLLLGTETEAFEAEFAKFLGGSGHVVAVASGTDALQLSLVALGIGPGDEVLVPAFTAVPTAAAVCAAGATPVPVDVDAATAALDPAAAAAAVTDRTRAVVPVHLYGRPAPLPELGLPVVEDAAQAHGALDPNGPRGIAVAYSFYPTKNLGGIGDGGAVVTADADLAARLRRLRAHGQHEHGSYEHVEIAGNSRLSELEAAALRVGLTRLAAGNARRRMIATRYRDAAPHSLRWQAAHERHVYHQCVARVSDRDSFQPAYRGFVRTACPEAEAWAAECVSLPCFPELTDDEIETVCRAFQ
jgi:dTDP-3-amino-3,4,6-trideoxy-alpha-D-glucose transaminase